MSESSNKQYNCVVSSDLIADLKHYYSYSSIENVCARIARESGLNIVFHVDIFDGAPNEMDLKFKSDGSILADFDSKVDFVLCHKSDKHKHNYGKKA